MPLYSKYSPDFSQCNFLYLTSSPPQQVSISTNAFSGQALMHSPHLSQYSGIHACSFLSFIGRFAMLVIIAEIFCLGPHSGVIKRPFFPYITYSCFLSK